MRSIYTVLLSETYFDPHIILYVLATLLLLFIIWMLIALWAMNKATRRGKDRPLEELEKDEGTAWHHFSEAIHRGVDFINSLPHKTLKTTSHDGLTLYADLIEHESPKATILMFHGYRSAGSNDFSCATEFYYSLGFNLLIVDQRSHGRSEGKYIGFGALERFDCQKWAQVISELYGKELPIIITGVSMGASTVLMASSLPLPVNTVAIIADCGFTSPHDIIAHVIKKSYRIAPCVILPGMNIWSKILAGYSFKEISTCKALEKNTLPVLFIHGLDDDFVPSYMSKRAFQCCKAKKEIILVKGAGHGESYLIDSERCQNTLKAFLEECFISFNTK